MYQIFISGYRLVDESHGKPYYTYTVEMVNSDNGARNCIERRYSEFNALHRLLKKESETAVFPPKRVRNSNRKVLEHRRAALEVYMQKMLYLPNTKQQVLSFLGIDGRTSQICHNIIDEDCEGKQSRTNISKHHPVLSYQNDPYIHANTSSNIPDIITNGVLLGIYKS